MLSAEHDHIFSTASPGLIFEQVLPTPKFRPRICLPPLHTCKVEIKLFAS